MKFYHATTHEIYDMILKEGVLFGRHFHREKDGPIIEHLRYTFLAVDINYAKHFGSVILEVEYEPYDENGEIRKDKDGKPLNDYDPKRWDGKNFTYQIFRVYEPISIDNIKCVKIQK